MKLFLLLCVFSNAESGRVEAHRYPLAHKPKNPIGACYDQFDREAERVGGYDTDAWIIEKVDVLRMKGGAK